VRRKTKAKRKEKAKAVEMEKVQLGNTVRIPDDTSQKGNTIGALADGG
jgi:hypothetical protein